MTKNNTHPMVDAFMSRAMLWRVEMEKLREIIQDCQLSEDLKWGKPCYAYKDANVVILQPFKEYCALLFFKGVLLKDPNGILVKTGVNTRVGRQIRFTDVRDINKMEHVLKAYIKQAVEAEKAGLKVDLEKNTEIVLPEELRNKMEEMPALKTAFEGLTPGRQRGYVFYFSGAKQSATRAARVDKFIPQILKGRGLNDS